MDPKFANLEKLYFVGMEYYGDNAHGEIPELWTRFLPRMGEITNKTGSCSYGLCVAPEDYESTGKFSYIAALGVSDLNSIPAGMVGKEIPAGRYAVFTHKGLISGLRATYEKIYGTWLQDTDLEVIQGYGFELYDDRFTTIDDPESELDIYVPVK